MVAQLRKLLESTSVDTIPTPKGQIVVVHSHEFIVDGFSKLLDNRILSAPVYDKASGKYTGFLDIRDLVSFCVFIHDSNVQAENLLDIVNFGVKMFKHAFDGVTVTYLSRRNPFHAVKPGSPLSEAVDILARGVRRVPVVNEQNEVVNIISQSSIVQFLQHHIAEFAPSVDKAIADLQIGSSPVMSVNKDTKAIDVFRLMDHHQRSGVAVVDEHGVIVGNTSGHDLKLFIMRPSLAVLQQPIMQFLNQIRSLNIDIMVPVVTCAIRDHFPLALGKLAATRVHRVFIVDDEYHPVRVISITDVLRYIKTESGKE